MVNQDQKVRARAIFRRHGGILRTKDAIRLGIHPRTLYALRDAGELQQVTHGYYRLSDLPEFGDPDLVTVALAVPKSVICLVSALSYHGIGTQIPRAVDIAIERQMKRPRIQYPPIRTFWFSGPAFTAGVRTHDLDGVPVKVYGPAKTVADCFKFRNRIGLDVAIEALREVRRDRLATADDLFEMARICRVGKVMRPYLEAMP
ncbi:MAG TPA: type IV toxin-antitoxin system AbiEi family antitoxin domain-containing protein [Phycisphaerae bacterium]|nr:type IV toxin-antitoxin system AbiEi family antitoxin domain-containing protein [Phycisphaerae bacterium]